MEQYPTKSDDFPERLRDIIKQFPVVDCHDHIAPREKVLESGDVLLDLLAACCLPRDAAADPALQTRPYDPAKSWELVSHHLPNFANTSAYRCVAAACRLLYDFDAFPLDEKGYHELRERMENAYRQEDWYFQALRQKANIDAVIQAISDPASMAAYDPELFLPVPNVDDFLCAYSSQNRQRLERAYHVRLQTFDDFTELVTEATSQYDEEGVPAFWLSHCKSRPLVVAGVDSRQVAANFGKPDDALRPDQTRQFQDFVIHFIADRCAALNVPIQIDTGAYADTVSVERSDPCQLTGFIAAHMKTRFVLLHGGHPFGRNLGALAKTFINITVDGSSLTSHSVSVMKDTVGEWLELVPVAKILLWGGNSRRIEMTVGSLMLTREALVEMLAFRVRTRLFSETLALDLARRLLRDTPRRFYKTDEMRMRRKALAQA